MDPGIFPSFGDRPGFGPESQKYGDPRSEILGFREHPGTAPRADPNHSSLLRSRAQAVFLFVDGGGDGYTVHCLTTHVLLALERLRTRFCIYIYSYIHLVIAIHNYNIDLYK